MGRLGRCVGVLALAVACGCAWGKRPYTGDPLLAGGRGVWGKPPSHVAPQSPPEPTPIGPNAPATVTQ